MLGLYVFQCFIKVCLNFYQCEGAPLVQNRFSGRHMLLQIIQSHSRPRSLRLSDDMLTQIIKSDAGCPSQTLPSRILGRKSFPEDLAEKTQATAQKAAGTHEQAAGTHEQAAGTHEQAAGTHEHAAGTDLLQMPGPYSKAKARTVVVAVVQFLLSHKHLGSLGIAN